MEGRPGWGPGRSPGRIRPPQAHKARADAGTRRLQLPSDLVPGRFYGLKVGPPPLQKAKKRLRGEPCPDPLHNKGIPKPGLTLPPSRPAATRPRHISRLAPPSCPGLAGRPPPVPAAPTEPGLTPPLPPCSPGTSGARPSPSPRPACSDLHPPRAAPAVRSPALASLHPAGPGAPPAFRPLGELRTALRVPQPA
ncbi:splicing factor 3A subunit 2-like [Ovis canadensis]|uniref:splicing factor 3A subunit 2-like n=1 Tax=Ovis canadensis TaxID=37174 RepID=UPI0037503BFC